MLDWKYGLLEAIPVQLMMRFIRKLEPHMLQKFDDHPGIINSPVMLPFEAQPDF